MLPIVYVGLCLVTGAVALPVSGHKEQDAIGSGYQANNNDTFAKLPEGSLAISSHQVKSRREVRDDLCSGVEDGILIPSTECDKFFMCWYSDAYLFTCPSDIFFNIDANACDWPVNVDCTGRMVPVADSVP